MSAAAITMMVVAMVVIWGGFALAVASLVRHGAVEDREEAGPAGTGPALRRDL